MPVWLKCSSIATNITITIHHTQHESSNTIIQQQNNNHGSVLTTTSTTRSSRKRSLSPDNYNNSQQSSSQQVVTERTNNNNKDKTEKDECNMDFSCMEVRSPALVCSSIIHRYVEWGSKHSVITLLIYYFRKTSEFNFSFQLKSCIWPTQEALSRKKKGFDSISSISLDILNTIYVFYVCTLLTYFLQPLRLNSLSWHRVRLKCLEIFSQLWWIILL